MTQQAQQDECQVLPMSNPMRRNHSIAEWYGASMSEEAAAVCRVTYVARNVVLPEQEQVRPV
jgi:hypothetical protein